jgi:hypothetical protein
VRGSSRRACRDGLLCWEWWRAGCRG